MENVETKIEETITNEASANPEKDKAPKKERKLPPPIMLITKERQLIAMVADSPTSYTKTYYNKWVPGQALTNPVKTKKVTLPVGIDKFEFERPNGSHETTTKANNVWDLWTYLTTAKGYKRS